MSGRSTFNNKKKKRTRFNNSTKKHNGRNKNKMPGYPYSTYLGVNKANLWTTANNKYTAWQNSQHTNAVRTQAYYKHLGAPYPHPNTGLPMVAPGVSLLKKQMALRQSPENYALRQALNVQKEISGINAKGYVRY